jgi:hypothetical protein
VNDSDKEMEIEQTAPRTHSMDVLSMRFSTSVNMGWEERNNSKTFPNRCFLSL